MATELAKAYVQIIPSAEGISGTLTNLLSGESQAAGESSGKSLGSSLVSALTGVVAAAGIGKMVSSAINEGMTFDSAISQLAATMGTTTDQITELRDCAQEMGSTTAFSATEAAQGLNILAQAGLSADEQMETIPTVLNLASAGCMDLESAASYVTGAVKGFGDSMDNADYYADLMAKGATLANTDVTALGEAMSGSAATASSYGQSAEGTTLALLRLAEQNVTGSEATTALNRAMADLYTPTDAAKGALEELGVACYDETGAARDVNDVMDDLSAALAGMSDEQANAYKDTIFTSQGLNAFNKMTASSSDTVDGFKDALNDCSGSAAQQADTQLDNLQGDMTLLKSAISGAQIAVSDELTPALRDITQFGTEAVSALTEGFTEDGISGFVSALGDVVGEGIQGLADFLPDFISFGIEMISSLVEGVAQMLPDLVSSAAEAVNSFIGGLTDMTGDVLQAGIDLFMSLVDAIPEVINNLMSALPDIITSIVTFIVDALPQITEAAVTMLTGLVDAIPQVITAITSSLPQIITSIVSGIASGAPDILQAGIDLLMNIIEAIPSVVISLASSLPDIITAIISGLIDAIPDVFSAAKDLFWQIIEAIPEIVTGIAEAVPDIIKGIVDGLLEGIKSVKDAALELGKGILNGIKEFFGISSPSTVMQEQGQYIVQGLENGLSDEDKNAVKEATSIGTDVMNGIKNGADSLTSTVTGFFGEKKNDIINKFSDIKDKFTEVGKRFSGTESGASSVSSVVTDFFGSAKDKIVGKFDNLKNKFSEIGGRYSEVKSGANSVSSVVTDFFGTSKEKILAKFDNMKDKFTSIGEKFSGIKSGASSKWSDLSSWLGEKNQDIVGKFSNMQDKFTTVGSQICSGIQNGISNGWSALTSWVGQKANSLLDSAKNALGISSPSKRFEDEFGEMIGAGAAVGLENSIGEVESAMDDLLDAVDPSEAEAQWNRLGITEPQIFGTVSASTTPEQIEALNTGFAQLYALLERYLPQLADMQVVTDTGALVGELAAPMDAELGRLSARKARGAV